MELSSISVDHPERIWLAKRSDFPEFQDPDLVDGVVLYEDTRIINWAAISDLVSFHGERIVAGKAMRKITKANGSQSWSYSLVGLEDLPVLARHIVKDWLGSVILGPKGDVGARSVYAGRRRLWNCWQARPDAWLPVHSELLRSVDDLPQLGAGIRSLLSAEAQAALEGAEQATLRRSPRYKVELMHWAGLYASGPPTSAS